MSTLTKGSELVTKTEFAGRIGRTKQYVGKLVKRGLPVHRDGKVYLQAGLDWYRANVVPQTDENREKSPRGEKSKPTKTSGPTDSDVEAAYAEMAENVTRAEADRRLTAAKASLAELELAKARGELIEADSVIEVWGGRVSAAKARLLLIPPAVTAKFGPEVAEEVARGIDQALVELSGQ